jgi:hypothetical protein
VKALCLFSHGVRSVKGCEMLLVVLRFDDSSACEERKQVTLHQLFPVFSILSFPTVKKYFYWDS